MAYNTLSLPNKDNQKLFIHHWPVAEPKAQLFMVHGYAEHGYRYEHVARALNDAHIEVYAYDQRGHGRSEGLSAYIPSFDLMIDDLSDVLTKYISAAIPSFLFGHSMGGLVAVKYSIERKESTALSGLITTGAALKIDKDLSPLLQMFAPILGKIAPKMKTTPLEITTLTRSAEELEKYENDPLVYRQGTRARTGAELLSAIKELEPKFPQLSLPYLGMHGLAEKIADPVGTKELHRLAKSTDKTIKLYEGLYHELVNEPERDGVIDDIKEWIIDRSK